MFKRLRELASRERLSERPLSIVGTSGFPSPYNRRYHDFLRFRRIDLDVVSTKCKCFQMEQRFPRMPVAAFAFTLFQHFNGSVNPNPECVSCGK